MAPDAKKQQEKLGGNQQQPRKRSPSLSENAPGVCGLSESCRGFSTHVFGTFLGTLFLRSASRRVSVSSFVKLLPRFGHVFFAFGSRVSQLFAPVVILKRGKIKRPENVIHRVFSCLLHFLEFGLDVSVTFFFAFGSRVSQFFATVMILKSAKIKRPENVIQKRPENVTRKTA